MATYERVEQELNDAKVQLVKAETEVKAFKEGQAQGKLLERLRLRLDGEEGTATQRAEWREEKEKLEKKEERLDVEKAKRIAQVEELQRALTAAKAQPGRVRPRSPEEPDDSVKRQKMLEDQEEIVGIISDTSGPSSLAYPTRFQKFNSEDSPKILNLRPPSCRGPPVTLFHPVFDQFLMDLSDVNLTIPPNRYDEVREFSRVAGVIYSHERDRDSALQPFFASLFDASATSIVTDNRAQIDEALLIDAKKLREKAAPIMWEIKNEIGTGAADPSIQGACSYMKYWAQERVTNIRKSSCCPSIIMAIAGPWICILGAVFLDKPVVEPLTDFILMIDRPQDNGRRITQLTTLFEALHRAYKTLSRFYKDLDMPNELEIQKAQRMFPYHRQYICDGKTVKFTYCSKLIEGWTRLIWKAETDEGQIVIIKFADQYNAEAHQLLANQGLSPRLYYVSDNASNRWQMIVMDIIDHININAIIEHNQRLHVFSEVKRALDILHREDIVFGDLRLPNILVSLVGEQTHVKLVDFDWCGKEGMTKYPPILNPDCAWPEGVKPCGLLSKSHDLYWLENLRKSLNI